MSSGELLLTGFVAVIVFGPTKLPELLKHMGLVVAKLHALKEQVHLFWQKEIQEEQLRENESKALVADKEYKANN
jgi:sec-independent protein translocase protein TatB